MLAIQPVSLNNYPKNVSFKQGEREVFENDKTFYESQKREIENLLSDEKLPKGMKKFLNIANIVTDGLVAGFTVACATIASANCGKSTFSRLAKNNTVRSAVDGFKPLGEYAVKGFNILKHHAADFARKLFGKEKGQKIVDGAKTVLETVKKIFSKLNLFKNEETYDKAVAKAATGLGVGAGAASAYAKTVEKSENESGEE